jgi:predicted dehydrogenase
MDPGNGHGPARLALLGAGQRGTEAYGAIVLARPDLARFVAVAEPNELRRERFAAAHGIGPRAAFARWEDLLEQVGAPGAIDGVVVATPDRVHVEPTVAALARDLDVLLEKPIAPSPAGVDAIARAAASSAGDLTVAHPLRYTEFFATIAALVSDGAIGRLVEIDHLENVSWWHFAHSFVRGNWRRSDLASPLILAKACHDLDVVRWLAAARCTSVASFGSLSHFRPEEAPPGAPDHCLDGCPVAETCPFYAPRFYLPLVPRGGWPVSVVSAEPGEAALLDALRTGPYGRCVYHADNDVADHQGTILEFANGVVATLTVTAFTAENTRSVKLMGTRGEIRGHMERGEIEVRRFIDGQGTNVPPAQRITVETGDGHAGGDARLVEAFVGRLVAAREGVPVAESQTSLAVSLDSHRMAFAAERSRLNHVVERV